jgi:hypothetical protein
VGWKSIPFLMFRDAINYKVSRKSKLEEKVIKTDVKRKLILFKVLM